MVLQTHWNDKICYFSILKKFLSNSNLSVIFFLMELTRNEIKLLKFADTINEPGSNFG